VPGPGDDVTLTCDLIIEGPACSADIGRFGWGGGPADSITLYIVNAEFRFREGEESGDGSMTIDISGTSNVDCWDDRLRFGNHGHGVINLRDSSVLHVNGDLRGGDEDDGRFDLNMSGGVLDVEGEILQGDDGGGVFTFNGGDTVSGQFTVAARKGGTVGTMVVNGGEIYVDEFIRFGKDCKDGGGFASLLMTGGTINADEVRFGCNSCVDVNVTIDGGLLIARSDLCVGDGDGDVSVALNGGEIRVESGDSLEIGDNGTIDICGGTLKIKGNKVAEISALVCHGSGRLTGCGSPSGVFIEYDGVYTVVTGGWDPWPDGAYCLDPACGAERIAATEVVLCWQPGACIGSRGRHVVYFSSDCDAVENEPPCSCPFPGGCLGVLPGGQTCVDVGPLELWTTYCWRVDEFCEDGRCVKGCVCSFTTGCEDIPGDVNRDCLVNFEDYACVAGDFGLEQFWPAEE
jgi:hypothetical protein